MKNICILCIFWGPSSEKSFIVELSEYSNSRISSRFSEKLRVFATEGESRTLSDLELYLLDLEHSWVVLNSKVQGLQV